MPNAVFFRKFVIRHFHYTFLCAKYLWNRVHNVQSSHNVLIVIEVSWFCFINFRRQTVILNEGGRKKSKNINIDLRRTRSAFCIEWKWSVWPWFDLNYLDLWPLSWLPTCLWRTETHSWSRAGAAAAAASPAALWDSWSVSQMRDKIDSDVM